MPEQILRIVLVPWGTDNAGDDLWLFENGLVFAVESLIDALKPDGLRQYADMYSQMGGENIRSSAIRPLSEEQLVSIAERAPQGTTAVVDGMLKVWRNYQGGLYQVQVAPRILTLSDMRFAAPDAFIFDDFPPDQAGSETLRVDAPEAFHGLAFAAASAILEAAGYPAPAEMRPAMLQITNDWDAYLLFLKAKRLARTVDEKIGYYRQAVSRDPAFYWARYNLGQLLKQQEDYAGARREFLAASKAAGDDTGRLADALFEAGLSSILMGDAKAARRFWDEALAHAPENPSLLVNIAGTYEQEEDWREAMALHERAIAVSPEYHKAIVSLARLKAMVGKVEEAIPLYMKALQIQPDDPLREAILGGCYLAVGDPVRAAEHLRRASELDPPRTADVSEQPSPGDYARSELAKLTGAG